jgi:hypothetical protein
MPPNRPGRPHRAIAYPVEKMVDIILQQRTAGNNVMQRRQQRRYPAQHQALRTETKGKRADRSKDAGVKEVFDVINVLECD